MLQGNLNHIYWNTQQLHPDVVAVFSSSLPLSNYASEAPSAILLPQQTHSVNVSWVTNDIVSEVNDISLSPLFHDTDALITDIPGLTIGVRTADCVPILLYAADIRSVAAIHAGWKGTLHGIIDNVIDRLTARGSHPSKIHACFGPSICPQCYEVDPSLAQQFIDAGYSDCVNYDHTIDPLTGKFFAQHKPHLNLVKINTRRMIDKGMQHRYINITSSCTRHTYISNKSDKQIFPLHSWRRVSGTTDRLITAITLLP